jgi:hypothetical protein
MQARAWIAITVIGIAGFAVKRGSSEEPAKLVAPAKIVRAVAAPTPMRAPVRVDEVDDPDEVAADDSDGDEPVADDELPALVVEKPLPSARGNTIHGRFHETTTGELLAGVTIVASSPVLDGVQTAISDEDGYYKITDLPAGEYLVTIYYLERTIEHPHVQVSAMAAAIVDDDIDTGFQVEPIVVTITED